MKKTAELEKKADVIQVKGILDSDTIMTIMPIGYRLIKSLTATTFDFHGVTQSDSAALALLLAWIRYSKKCGKKIFYTHIPIAMVEIAEACRLNKFFSFSSSGKLR